MNDSPPKFDHPHPDEIEGVYARALVNAIGPQAALELAKQQVHGHSNYAKNVAISQVASDTIELLGYTTPSPNKSVEK